MVSLFKNSPKYILDCYVVFIATVAIGVDVSANQAKEDVIAGEVEEILLRDSITKASINQFEASGHTNAGPFTLKIKSRPEKSILTVKFGRKSWKLDLTEPFNKIDFNTINLHGNFLRTSLGGESVPSLEVDFRYGETVIGCNYAVQFEYRSWALINLGSNGKARIKRYHLSKDCARPQIEEIVEMR